MEGSWYSTPEGAMNLILGGVLAATIFFGLIFGAVWMGLLPTIA